MLGYPSHVDLTVSSLDVSVAFYDQVLTRLGFSRERAGVSDSPCWIRQENDGPAFSIALHRAREPRPHDRYAPGLHHLAFRAVSREQVDGFFDDLTHAGIRILDPPAEYRYTPGYYAVFFADPDGLKLELVYEPEPNS